jgi:hypothetical protein
LDRSAWNEVFSDLNEMACCLSLPGSQVAESDVALLDEGGNFDSEYRRAAEFGRPDLQGSPHRATHVLALLGWG